MKVLPTISRALGRIIGKTSTCTLQVTHLHRTNHGPEAPCGQSNAIIHVVVSDGESLFVKTADRLKDVSSSQETGCGCSRGVAGDARLPEVPIVIAFQHLECVTSKTVVVAMHDSGVLNAAVGKQEFGAH